MTLDDLLVKYSMPSIDLLHIDTELRKALPVNDLATWVFAGAAGVGRGSPTAVPPGTSSTVNADSGPSGQLYRAGEVVNELPTSTWWPVLLLRRTRGEGVDG